MSFALLLGLLTPTARSCDPMPMMAFEPASDAEDTEAPQAPILREVNVHRGQRERLGQANGARCWSATTGTLSFSLEQPGVDAEIDEGSDPSVPLVGYRLRVVEGELPAELEQSLEGAWHGLPYWSEAEPYVDHIYFQWDDPPRRQEGLTAVVEIVAVDRAGNESPPLRVDVTDPDPQDRPGGCSHAPVPAGWSLGLLALAAARRRARRA